MTQVQNIIVTVDEVDLRLDRWFRRHFPQLAHGRLEKLLRTGQVRIDGKRATANARLIPDQTIRVPPLQLEESAATSHSDRREFVSAIDAKLIESLVIYEDEAMIALNKPAGLAVQGGSGTLKHIDGMLDALRDYGRGNGKDRPRLVHRLDRDTSGVLVIARNAKIAAILGKSFQGHETEKTYWAVVAGTPEPNNGRIDLSLVKGRNSSGQEVMLAANGIMRMRPNSSPHSYQSLKNRFEESEAVDDSAARAAITEYRTVDSAGDRAAWLELKPLTGRTHQVRVHCAALGTPILGDAKYGGAAAFLPGIEMARQLHLHARRLRLPHPVSGERIEITAEMPPHMDATWRTLGFDLSDGKAIESYDELPQQKTRMYLTARPETQANRAAKPAKPTRPTTRPTRPTSLSKPSPTKRPRRHETKIPRG